VGFSQVARAAWGGAHRPGVAVAVLKVYEYYVYLYASLERTWQLRDHHLQQQHGLREPYASQKQKPGSRVTYVCVCICACVFRLQATARRAQGRPQTPCQEPLRYEAAL